MIAWKYKPGRLLAGHVLLVAALLLSGASHAQSPWKGVGTILAVTGDVVVIGGVSRESPAAGFSVLEEGTTLKVGVNGHVRLVHDKEGTTYEIRGPAVAKVSGTSVSVEPASAIANRTAAAIPAELSSAGGVPTADPTRGRQVGGENLNTSRAGLVASTEANPAPSANPPNEAGSAFPYGLVVAAVLVLLGWAAAAVKTTWMIRTALVVLGFALGGWYIFKPSPAPEMKELMSALDSAKKANEALLQAKQGEERAQIALAEARKAEEEAKSRGDRSDQARLAAESEQRRVALEKEADLVRQRDAEAHVTLKAAEEKIKSTEGAKSKTEAQKKSAVEKSAEVERPTAVAAAPAAPKSESVKRKTTLAMGAAERMAIREEEAARAKADAAGNVQIAGAAPSSVEAKGSAAVPALSLYEQAQALERSGNIKGAVRLYVRAIREGDYRAAKALGDIFAEGKGDVPKDYGESLRYYALAEKNGIEVPRAYAR